MERKDIDWREYFSGMNCTDRISADAETELLKAAIQHATAVHGEKDTPELRAELRKMVETLSMARAA